MGGADIRNVGYAGPENVGGRPYGRDMANFAVRLVHGPGWDPGRPIRRQDGWDEHAAFMDGLVKDGFIILGGPVGDGEQTLQVVEEFAPDLLLLDVMMPRLSGFEVCKKIRANPESKDLLILMITALNEAADFERGVQAGTDDFLTKPLDFELLVEIIRNRLAQSPNTAAAQFTLTEREA